MRNARKRRLKRAQRKPAAKRDAQIGKVLAKKKVVRSRLTEDQVGGMLRPVRKRLDPMDDIILVKPKRTPGRPKKASVA